MTTLLILLGAVATVLVGGDWVYDRVMTRRYNDWEKGIERDADGVRTGCREITQEGDGRRALLLVHGFGDSPAIFRNIAPVIADAGLTCRAMRLPGFAMPMQEYRRTSLDKWLDAVQLEVAALRSDHDEVWIGGHSMGAAIVLQYVTSHPGQVDGAVLFNPMIRVSNARSPVLPARAWYHIARFFLHKTVFVQNNFSLDFREPAAAAEYPVDRFVPRVVFDEVFRLADGAVRHPEQLRIPLLMLVSRNDVVTDTKAAENYWRRTNSPRKEIGYFDHYGHMLAADLCSPEVAEAVVRFVTEDN